MCGAARTFRNYMHRAFHSIIAQELLPNPIHFNALFDFQ
jgi:hypothetical protein